MTNPYQAPISEPGRESGVVDPAEFIPGRMEFKGEVSDADHRDAVTKAGIRKEFRSGTRAMMTLGVVFVVFAVVMLFASDRITANGVLRTVTASTLFLGGVTIFCVNHRWLIGIQVPSYQLARGPIQGWIDRDGLWIESTGHQSFSPLSALVASAATHDLWVLSFGKDLTFWQAIPLEAFDDPSLARAVAQDIGQVRPPSPAELIDDRKRSPPSEASRFSPAADAIRYSGAFNERAARDTKLIKATKRIARRTWLSLAAFLICAVASLLVMAGFRSLYLALAGVWLLFFFGNIGFRVMRARNKAKHNGQVVAWVADGWLDADGYCAMTAIGQARSNWSFFDHYEVTDDAIGLYPHPSDACCCMISREQFPSETDWEKATTLVHQKMGSTDGDRH